MKTACDVCPPWSITHREAVSSTQVLARELPAWSALWADAQTSGRGQAERTFVSDPGGLYLTAVLPYAGDALASRGFALAVGWALCDALRKLGVSQIRLRWPNDLMVEMAKVGGILVEQGGPCTLLVGVGLNVSNRPWLSDASLTGIAGCLAESSPSLALPSASELTAILLNAIRVAYEVFAEQRLVGVVPLLEQCWGAPREVRLEPAGGITLPATGGIFLGIDLHGAVRLRTAPGVETRVPAHHIHRLREVG